MIEVCDLSYRYSSEEIFSRISFDVAASEIVAILGPSGVGKTTLLRCIAGLLDPLHGSVLIDGLPPASAAKGQHIGFLFQQDSLLEWRTVRENVMLPFEAAKAPETRKAADQNVISALELVGLSDAKSKFPNQLSGGMRQRVALARALAAKPRVLLLDEPFAAVDLLTRERIMIELHSILRIARTPTIFITHFIEEAIFLADRLLILGGSPAAIVETREIEMGDERTGALLSDPEFLRQISDLKRRLRAVGWVRE